MRKIEKEHFESLVGFTISDSDFRKIKMHYELLTCVWKNEDHLAYSFRSFGMEHLDDIFSNCVRIQKKLLESGEISLDNVSLFSEEDYFGHGDNCNDKTHEDESEICQSVDMAALKGHFESITNCTVTDNEYYRIEKCINAFSGLLATDNDIALFYHTFGMDGIDRLNCHRAGEKSSLNHFREAYRKEINRYLDLRSKYSQLSSYITAFLKAMVKFFNEILNDPLFVSNYNNSDYTRAFFISFINYLNKEIERFESEVK